MSATLAVTGERHPLCEWRDCPNRATFWVAHPDWREGGVVGFCSTEHLHWLTYAVSA